MTLSTFRYAIVFLAWGEKSISEIQRFMNERKSIREYDLILITDPESECNTVSERFHAIVRVEFGNQGLLRKCELLDHLPSGYDAYCFLDTDIIIMGDISLGFEKAMTHGLALSPAPHYSLDHFWGFDEILKAECVPCKGQLQYNTGVIFFSLNHNNCRSVFRRWRDLAIRHKERYTNDQPFFTLAMELENFNPCTLSIGYNYRGFGDPISGEIRIWHSHGEPPPDLNVFEAAWPPRRAWPDRLEHP